VLGIKWRVSWFLDFECFSSLSQQREKEWDITVRLADLLRVASRIYSDRSYETLLARNRRGTRASKIAV
jgi:hypothetical protein